MASGRIFNQERGTVPDVSNARFIRLGHDVMGNPGMLDDLAILMRDAADQLEREELERQATKAHVEDSKSE